MNLNEDGSSQAAVSLADYRSLYRQYRSDPDLQRIHAMAPFVTVWDDHEFADDSWQHHATHFNESQGDEGDIERRTAASRAWYEYQPADVLYRQGNSFPEDMSIQRSLRFGRHCELFLTDLRSFRADHLVPEGPENTAVGKFNANSALGSRNFVLKNGFDALEQEAQPSMLGQEQKDWFLEGVLNSEATWKIWGNEVQTAQMLIDLSSFENLVSLAGDIHAFYASELQVDFDAPADPVGVEYTVAGISSTPVQTITQRTVDGDELLQALGLGDLVPRFDELMQSASPHYRYAASNENGVGVATVSAESFEMTFLTVSDPTDIEYGGVIKRTQFRTPLGSNQVELV
jgi:alkaline phosphatase D